MKIFQIAIVLLTTISYGFAQTTSGSEKYLRLWIVLPSGLEKNSIELAPNPLTLLIKIGEDGLIKLNGQNLGQLSNPTLLITKITRILQERQKNGVLSPGTNEMEGTVSFQVDRTVNYQK